MTNNKTLIDLQHTLEGIGMTPEEVNNTLTMIGQGIGTKYMTELYAVIPEDVIEKVQTMDKDLAVKAIHEAYFEKTGKQATDRLDEIISLTVEEMIEKPGDFFQKKGE